MRSLVIDFECLLCLLVVGVWCRVTLLVIEGKGMETGVVYECLRVAPLGSNCMIGLLLSTGGGLLIHACDSVENRATWKDTLLAGDL